MTSMLDANIKTPVSLRPSPGSAADGVDNTGTIMLVAAVRDELKPVIQRLKLQPDRPWFVGQAGSKSLRRIVAGVTGMGAERAVEVFSTMLEEHRPSHVIHLGFAGGLNPSLAAGTTLNIQWVINGQGQAYQLTDDRPLLIAESEVGDPRRTLLTMDHLIHSVEEKQQLYARHKAAAVDMETFHLAQVSAQCGLKMRMIRAISDPANMAIPTAAENWVRPDGTDNVPAAVWHLMTHPWKIPITVRLGRHVALAGKNLADAVEAAVRQLA